MGTLAVCAAVAGATAGGITTPLDVLKTRIMLSTGVGLFCIPREEYSQRGRKRERGRGGWREGCMARKGRRCSFVGLVRGCSGSALAGSSFLASMSRLRGSVGALAEISVRVSGGRTVL